MKRTLAFAKRNFTELARDVLSYIFCIAFPLVMLFIMTVVNESIPKESGMTIFRIDNLLGGIAIFGLFFVMLFTGITVAKDRSSSFLTRLYASPMGGKDFAAGYILPMLLVALVQAFVAFFAAWIISLITDYEFEFLGLVLGILAVLPSALLYTALGFLFGTIFNEKAAPGICSIIISLGSFIGGIWFDVEHTGGIMEKIASYTPFFYSVKVVRAAIHLDFGGETFLFPLLITLGCAALMTVIASVVFGGRMKADLS